MPFEGFYVELAFEFPVRGETVSAVGIGRDGDFAANPDFRSAFHEAGDARSGWAGGSAGRYMGCFDDANPDANPDMISNSNWGLHGPMTENPTTPKKARDNCASRCTGYA